MLDHLFLLVSPGAPEARYLVDAGFIEGTASSHPGQGSANRRFFLADFMLELLYIRDEQEAREGAGQRLRLDDRWQNPDASRLGLVFKHPEEPAPVPFPHWSYFPDYFNGKHHFPIGNNSDDVTEPLLICMPASLPRDMRPDTPVNSDVTLRCLALDSPVVEPTEALQEALSHASIPVCFGQPSHHATLTLQNAQATSTSQLELSPQLHLVVAG